MRKITTDVLIVGAGPSGLTASALLAANGISTLSIARHRGTAHLPRAHITNQRTLEVFREMGIEDRVKEVGVPLAQLGNNLMVTSLAGSEIARYKSYGSSAERLSDYAAASPCASVNAPQHVLDPVLLSVARERGAEVRFMHELVDIEQTPEAVQVRVRERESGDEYMIQARYVIGADGARSRIAELLGFGFEGEAGLRGMANSWIEADLTKYTAHRPAVIYWVGQPGNEQWFGTASWVNVKPWTEWSLLHPWSLDNGPLTEEAVLAQARLTIGDPDVRIRIKDISTWQVNNVVATEYRKGRVFLAGDAAHRHPPTGGLGTNTSVQDSYNLAWKLALVLKGHAGESLLDSYDTERQPVGRQVVDRAIKSWHNMAKLVDALGFKPGQSEQEGWATLSELHEDSAPGVQRRQTLTEALQLQNYRSNALGVELGQRYASSAIVQDGTAFPEPKQDAELYYQRTTHPGAYLPHVWIEHDRKQVSTLDLVGNGRFSLIVGIGGEPWKQAAAAVSTELGIELAVFEIGLRSPYDDVVGDWAAVREIDDSGALLVRPDRHIAWRSLGSMKTPAAALREAFIQILARQP